MKRFIESLSGHRIFERKALDAYVVLVESIFFQKGAREEEENDEKKPSK